MMGAGTRSTFLSVAPLAFCLAFIWPFGGGRKVDLMAGTETPAARGTVQITTGNNGNTKLDVKVHALNHPGALRPSENAYVLWVQPPGHPPVNEGQITVDQHENGDLQTRTPYKRFQIFITGEQNARTQSPMGPRILSADVSHS
jgi:hypothetical protein